jgi:hypothetical protein
MSRGVFDLGDVDPLLFYALTIEDQIAVLDMLTMYPGAPGLMDGVADVAREQIAAAQVKLDRLIDEDDTWRPA